ncbi:putative ribosome biogenesis protein [Ordospora pajunii]|uniref:putative ribosome biogenesis protein n=1 Tax=Ordospora pajunii TaxID=3039483 RepID=UPI0029527981|nr:putative ribosome biogenesis protein [Ordospora pajunii]KAH9411988.1 putative ribosome biogenesis protein [Ordospora pajunii]
MKVKDRRNMIKMKISEDKQRKQNERIGYMSAHGPYLVVSVVSLGGDCTGWFGGYTGGKPRGLYYSEECKMNFLLQMTDGMDDFRTGYMCRSSDVVVFFVDSEQIDEERLKVVKRHMPSSLICVSSACLRAAARKLAKKHFPDEKIVGIEGMFQALGKMRIRNASVCKRPYLVPSSVYWEEGILYVEGLLKHGFVSNKVIVNGVHEMEIEEVIADRVYLGSELSVSIGAEEVKCSAGALECDEYECERMDVVSDAECSDDEELSEVSEVDYAGSECTMDDGPEEMDGFPSLIERYAGYRGIRNIATCDFKSCVFPEHYKELVFFDDFKKAERLVVEKISVMPSNQMIKMKLRGEGVPFGDVCVVFGCYEYESRKTIHNFYFDGKEALVEEGMAIDLGHMVVDAKPMLTKNLNQRVFKRQQELECGVLSFVGPITFNLTRVLIYKKSVLGELCGRTLAVIGTNGFTADRIVFDEVVVRGIPIKMKKRYSVIKRMFSSKDEVMYFRNIQLRVEGQKTTGFIKKPIGTKGLFKGYFTQPLRPGCKVTMSLYKRAFLENE